MLNHQQSTSHYHCDIDRRIRSKVLWYLIFSVAPSHIPVIHEWPTLLCIGQCFVGINPCLDVFKSIAFLLTFLIRSAIRQHLELPTYQIWECIAERRQGGAHWFNIWMSLRVSAISEAGYTWIEQSHVWIWLQVNDFLPFTWIYVHQRQTTLKVSTHL